MDKNKIMMIVIIALLVILLITVGVVGFFAVKSLTASDEIEVVEEVALVLDQTQKTIIPAEGSTAITIATQIPSQDNATHAIRFSFVMEVDVTDEAASTELTTLITSKIQLVQAYALDVILGKTYQELSRVNGKGELETEILARLQAEFNTNLIVNIIASEYILQ